MSQRPNNILEKIIKSIEPSIAMPIIDIIIEENINNENDILDLFIIEIKKLIDNKRISVDTYNTMIFKLSEVFNIDIIKINERYDWLEKMGLKEIHGLEMNHQLVYEIFDKFNELLNQNKIDHYYTSGILSFLLINRKLERYHHDIDVFVSEEHLELLEKECEKFDFSLIRKLGERSDGTQRRVLKIYYKDYDLPITVFMYTKNLDGSVTQKDYYYDNNGQLLVEEIYNSRECANLSFDDNEKYHNGIPYKSISLEALFLCKNGQRAKDIYDCNIMLSYVNREKLELLKNESSRNLPNKSFLVVDEKTKNFINGQIINPNKMIKKRN